MKTIPLSVPNLDDRELRYIKRCIDTNWVSSSGRFVTDLETAVRIYVNARHAIACVNGTSGLHIALQVCGVGRGDEVIVPTVTFIAPVNVVKYRGAEPVFMDCDDHLNIDCVKLREFCAKECVSTKSGLKNKKTGRIIKAVIPVHVFGNPCDMAAVMDIAVKYDLKVIEDATESIGAYYTGGRLKDRFTGTIGDFGVYSFNGNKIVTCGGGGMIVARQRSAALKIKYLVGQAKDDPVRYVHNEIGYNFALTNIQAAMGVAQLEKLERFIAVKKRNYEVYERSLRGVCGLRMLGVPENTRANYWFYSLIVDKDEFGMDREEMMARLSAKGIQTRPLWFLNHLQAPYRKNQAYRIEKADWFWKRILNLPCSTSLDKDDVGKVAAAIKGLRHT